MDDFDALMFGAAPEEDRAPIPARGIVEFNPDVYVRAYPDVGALVGDGEVESAAAHYRSVGRGERRLELPAYLFHLAGDCRERASHGEISINYDAVLRSASGAIFVVGWIDDRAVSLLSLSLISGSEGWNSRAIARCRRKDAEQAVGAGAHPFGFWLVEWPERPDEGRDLPERPLMLRCRLADGRFSQTEMRPRTVSDAELRETALGHFASLEYFGNRDIEAFNQLDLGAGACLIALNRRITAQITKAAHVERFGPTATAFTASYIVCLFGRPEYLFLQNALFATGARGRNVEFIYVSNSPELTEILHKEARIAERIYGLSLTLITLPDNAGFSAANNAAARAARSDRLVFINPDVFPRDDGWARRHDAIIETAPNQATRLFGAPLYYDDGSLMHGGMYFEVDQGLSVRAGGIVSRSLIRVEHYGKGAPAWSRAYTAARPVPAVTGAFISVDRAWFEQLGGFTEDYVFGHYEDADLCLKSLDRGVPAWLQDLEFWHLEGKGSTRRPVHEGGSLVNRWHFTRRWGALIERSLIGRHPQHELLATNAEPDDAPPAPDEHGRKPVGGRLRRWSRGGR